MIEMRDHVTLIDDDNLPRPGGHYSHAVRFGDFLFVSGQLGMRPDGSHTAHLPFESQRAVWHHTAEKFYRLSEPKSAD